MRLIFKHAIRYFVDLISDQKSTYLVDAAAWIDELLTLDEIVLETDLGELLVSGFKNGALRDLAQILILSSILILTAVFLRHFIVYNRNNRGPDTSTCLLQLRLARRFCDFTLFDYLLTKQVFYV